MHILRMMAIVVLLVLLVASLDFFVGPPKNGPRLP